MKKKICPKFLISMGENLFLTVREFVNMQISQYLNNQYSKSGVLGFAESHERDAYAKEIKNKKFRITKSRNSKLSPTSYYYYNSIITVTIFIIAFVFIMIITPVM